VENSLLFAQVALLIVLAPVLTYLTRLPLVVVEIILGAIAVWIGFIDGGNEMFRDLAKIAFFYLMFLAGLEIDLRKFFAYRDKLLEHAGVYLFSLYALSIMLYTLFDLNGVYIVALPIVSLGMIMVLINEQGKERPWQELLLINGVLGEIVSISAIVIYESFISYGTGIAFYQHLFTFAAVLLGLYYLFKLLYILFWWFPELRNIIMPSDDSTHQSIRVSVALFIIFVTIMGTLEIDMVLGAFFAGIYIANFFKHQTELPHTLHKIGFGFIVPLFFVYVGTTLDMRLIFSIDLLSQAFFIFAAMLFIRTMSAFVAYRGYLGNSKDTFLFALGDSMPITFIIAIATIAYEAQLLPQQEYFAFIIAAMFLGVTVMSVLKGLIYLFYARKEV